MDIISISNNAINQNLRPEKAINTQEPIDRFEKSKESSEPLYPPVIPTAEIHPDTLKKIPAGLFKYFSLGNIVTPLADARVTPKNNSDDIFTNITQMLKNAKKSIHIDMFNLDKEDLVNLLIKRAKDGISVNIILDPPNEEYEASRKEVIGKFKANGVNVVLYPALEKGDPKAKYGQINHVKLLIVDGKTCTIGGMNWASHSSSNHDYNVVIEGPVVEKMEWFFRKDWITSGGKGKQLPHIQEIQPLPEGKALVYFVISGLDPKEQTIEKTFLRAIENAKKTIHASFFAFSHPAIVEALIKAHKNDIDVKILLHPLKIDDRPINEKAAQKLTEAGITVKWYETDQKTEEKLHSKILLVDDDQTVLGSANGTIYGTTVNREADVEILSIPTNRFFEEQFQKDIKLKGLDKPIYQEEKNKDFC